MNDKDHKKQAANPAPDIAVALDYNLLKSPAPKVVAKGSGWLAEQIIAIAEANGIEVKEDPDLAQLLSSVDVDSEIPLEAFTAVAEILSYVYGLNDQWPEGVNPEPQSGNQPDNQPGNQTGNQTGTEKSQK